MKKYILILAAALLTSCSSSDESTVTVPQSGLYVAGWDDITFGATIANGLCTDIIMYVDGSYYGGVSSGIITEGEYPDYTYYCSDMGGLTAEYLIVAAYSAPTEFVASVCFCDNLLSGYLTCVKFTLSAAPLDADGNGVLDSWE